MTKTSQKLNGGSILVWTVLMVSFFLLIVLVLSSIFLPKIRTTTDVRKTTPAAYAAESALEWCLYVRRQTPPLPTPSPPVMANGATYINANTGLALAASDCLAAAIRVLGTYQGVSRAFEISF